jgi:hypothetical protein
MSARCPEDMIFHFPFSILNRELEIPLLSGNYGKNRDFTHLFGIGIRAMENGKWQIKNGK